MSDLEIRSTLSRQVKHQRELRLGRKLFPFVCQNKPSIRVLSTVEEPIICNLIPSVCIRRNSAGFTLIELIVVLTIAGVLLGVALPSFRSFVANNRLSAQSNELLGDLHFARSEAIRRGTRITICKSSNPTAASPTCDASTSNPWTTGRVIFIDGGTVGTIDTAAPADEILRVRGSLEGSNRLLGDSNNGSPIRIIYRETGITESLASLAGLASSVSDAQLRLCDLRGATFGRAIVISLTGRARVTSPGTNKTGGALSCT